MFNIFKKNESGQSMVLIALLITVLFGFGALAVDVGNMTYQKSLMQNAADAAALAGVQHLPNASTAKTVAKTYVNDKNGKTSDLVTVNTPYLDPITNKYDKTRIEVTVTRTFQNSLAMVLGPEFNSTEFTVRAVAQGNSIWNGQSLPFVNMLPITTEPINIWDKIGPGEFESIDKSEVEVNGSNFIITYSNGILLKNGTMANGNDDIKKNLALLWDAYNKLEEENKYIYCFSFSPEVLSRDYVYVEVDPDNKKSDDGKRFYKGSAKPSLGQENIRLDQLVLIECTWTKYDGSTDITIDYNGVMYDLGNPPGPKNDTGNLDDYPSGQFGFSEVGSKKLVE